jgi:hypothetical protein
MANGEWPVVNGQFEFKIGKVTTAFPVEYKLFCFVQQLFGAFARYRVIIFSSKAAFILIFFHILVG